MNATFYKPPKEISNSNSFGLIKQRGKSYNKYSKQELIKEIKQLKKKKKYGLVWDSEREPEKVVEMCKEKLPVLKEVKNKEIITDKNKPVNLLIEGDNYHALSVLNYTHQGKIDVIYIDPPYNTGAKNWKYNNNYVDKDDAYRHSKWLSMMYHRLNLAKKLLKKNGALICAIDDNEQAHLVMLLEKLYSSFEQHTITIVHNPKGVQGTNFSYIHEYAVFVIPKNKKIILDRNLAESEMYVSNLRNWGNESLRTDAKNCFYPIIVKDEKVIGFGDVAPQNFHPKSSNEKKSGGTIYVWPIDSKGIERKWRYARQSVEEIKNVLLIKRNKKEIQILIAKDYGTYKTVWVDKRYDASEYGTKLLREILPGCDFDFPKSLYTVYDCLYAVIGNRQNAVVLDFFAGSGTTGQAVLEMNKNGGNRQYILCTNNENNIATDVCYPRVQKVIKGYRKNGDGEKVKGLGGNLKYFKTDFVDFKELNDKNKIRLTEEAIEMLCVKEGTFEEIENRVGFKIFKNHEHYSGIIFDQLAIKEFKKVISDIKGRFSVYIFSLGDDTFDEEFEDIKQKIKLSPIPEAILKVYRRIFK
jgi:adenine-specific DNA-methyltransferase